MELKDFPLFSEDLITLTSEDDLSSLIANNAVHIQAYEEHWILQQGDTRVVVECNPTDSVNLERLVLRDQTRWVLATKKKKQLFVQYCMPVEVQDYSLDIGIDELIADDLYSKHEIKDKEMDLACAWLEEHFLVHSDAETWLTIARFSNRSVNGSFQLLGKGWRADVEPRDDQTYQVKRITRHVKKDTGFSLLVGSFAFVDASVATVLNSGTQKALLEAALRDNASYLELWNLYNDKEWQRALDEAEGLRSLKFISCTAFEEGRENAWRLTPRTQEDYQEFRQRWKGLDLRADQQVDINTNPPDWAEELTTEDSNTAQTDNHRGTISFEKESVVFRSASNGSSPPEAGWLYLSLAGNRTVGKRRLSAKQAIDTGKRLPQLKWLLEGVAVPEARRRRINGITPYARETFKGGKPTEMQKLALETALNTPDLSIVIGPPGTGKTQVIAALQRRLAEESTNQILSRQVLVSSYQHDAVDNALERSDVLGLPGARVGGKGGAEKDQKLIDPWVENLKSHLEGKVEAEYKKYPELQLIRGLSEKLALMRIAGFEPERMADELDKLLQAIPELMSYGLIIPPNLENELEDYIEFLRHSDYTAQKKGREDPALLRQIRALRTTNASFLDDGSDRAWDLLRRLKRSNTRIDPELSQLLEKAAASDQLDKEVLEQLTECKTRLLDQFLPDYRPPELRLKIDSRGLDLLSRLEQLIEKKVSERKQGVAWALEQLAESLEMDRPAAQAVVDEYSMVVGATCQQAAGKPMASLKAVTDLNGSEIEFDTVIVDEAARANPLDLFVPMSMARRRIILVGDDRQLPHMLEPDIEGDLQEEQDLTEQQLEAFRSSLFERLRIKLQDLEKKDAIPRVVMLDKQFRMHPVLGDFISEHFYEAVDLPKLNSGREKEDFAFSPVFLSGMKELSQHYQDKVCQWIDVPADAGKESKQGTSLIRNAEAEKVAEEVKRLLEAGGESLSVGVITFYAAQRDLIMEKLASTQIKGAPLMEKQENGYEPHDDFKWARKISTDGSVSLEERLRVGSVDAFQGKEFDVVLLSCVRTSKRIKMPATEPKEREKQLNWQFGFLRLPNRMNVAMSRQRQMLICVGDAALASGSDAEEAVPALAAFYELCGGEYGSRR
ncbi:DEAD/DEAH box helicase [Marinospirillum insulare]|uniref:AAA domain-containing protein n=1 Tax=Marinospirillum insulare TaxID=217169 RepID=A0ABQ5ZY44_9GAMM|nr:AAA domain-containing protein [Marinospirillum insulare]GLR62804.1 hypothetical protein GCM10007878_02390 [Marinospirillum insulare]